MNTEEGAPRLPSAALSGERDVRRRTPSLLLALLVGVGALALAIAARQGLEARARERVERLVELTLADVSDGVRQGVAGRVAALERMARRATLPGEDLAGRWRDDAAAYLLDPSLGMRWIAWIEPSLRARWIAPDVASTPDDAVDAMLAGPAVHATLAAARDARGARLTAPLEAAGRVDQEALFVVAAPILSGPHAGSLIAAAVPSHELLGGILGRIERYGAGATVDAAGRRVVDRHAPGSESGARLAREATLETHGLRWQVRVWPTPALLAAAGESQAHTALLVGLLLAPLLAALVYAGQTARLRAYEAEHTARRLAAEIAESQRLAAEKRASDQLLAELIDHIPALVYVKGLDDRYLLVNRTFAMLAGKTTAELTGASADDLVPADVAATMRENDRRMLESGAPCEFAEIVPLADGPHTFRTLKFPLLDERGEIYALCGISLDVTDQERANAALRESQEQLRLAVAGTRIGLWAWDPGRGALTLSPELKAQLGHGPEEMGDRFGEIESRLHPEDRDRVVDLLRGLQHSPWPTHENEFRLRHADGSYRWILGRAAIWRDDAGHVVRMLGLHLDITERKRAEEQIHRLNEELEDRVRERTAALEQANRELAVRIVEQERAEHALELTIEELERAGRLKSEFVAAMSHELRTPLSAILGFTELLLAGDYGELTEEPLEALRTIEGSARQLFELICQTLDLSRLEAGRSPVRLEPIDLRDLLADVESETRPLRDKPGLASGFEVAQDLPPIRTDAGKLKVVLKNLISNGVKFTERGELRVAAAMRAGRVAISVTDTGIGIAPETLPTIFDAFRQGDGSMTRKYGGVGLGLHVARHMLDLIGGSIDVESRVGHGSTFLVTLPLDAATSDLAADTASADPRAADLWATA